ncbi:type III secretion system gatekeeper subunit SctW [Pseudomonas bubulae]|uniref:type III secretion system gatekeeper subunit SctW n=1 Tax=Pseudomonas bubulae TaxID=2316085 RepID=UPI002B1E658D|nr:type III secretion system gatekeeper subunit SctW [Pseudomonas bubulae]
MPQSSAQSAAEEVGMLFSQKAESSSKALAQRALRTVDNRVQKVEGIQQLNELYEQLGHPAQLSLGLLTRHVRLALASDSGVEALLALTGDDPARTSVVLQYMVAQARAQGREGDIERVQKVQAQLHTRYDRQIQAGLNIALALAAAEGDAALRQAVRTLYYSSVVRKQSLPSIIQALLALFDEERINDGLRVMARALADDIAAHRPSVPSIRLRTLLSGLQGCTQLSSLLHSCRWFIERLSSRERQAELSPVSLLQRLLGYAGTGIDSDEVQSLSRELGGENLSSQLVLLNQVYPLIQRLPLAVWSDPASRQDALQSFLSLMGEHTQSEGIVQLSAGLTRPIR